MYSKANLKLTLGKKRSKLQTRILHTSDFLSGNLEHEDSSLLQSVAEEFNEENYPLIQIDNCGYNSDEDNCGCDSDEVIRGYYSDKINCGYYCVENNWPIEALDEDLPTVQDCINHPVVHRANQAKDEASPVRSQIPLLVSFPPSQ